MLSNTLFPNEYANAAQWHNTDLQKKHGPVSWKNEYYKCGLLPSYSLLPPLPRVQLEAIEREKERGEKHQQRVLRHAEGVRQQVREREMDAMAQRRELFQEGHRLDEEARQRRQRLNDIKDKKLQELR